MRKFITLELANDLDPDQVLTAYKQAVLADQEVQDRAARARARMESKEMPVTLQRPWERWDGDPTCRCGACTGYTNPAVPPGDTDPVHDQYLVDIDPEDKHQDMWKLGDEIYAARLTDYWDPGWTTRFEALTRAEQLSLWSSLLSDACRNIDFAKKVHRYLHRAILACFGVPAGDAGLGVKARW